MKGKAHKSLLWSAIQQFSTSGIQFVLGVILARLLNPYDYGLIAMQGVFFAISNAFVDFGFEGALIQKKTCNRADLNTAFLFSLSMAVVLYILLFYAAPLVADFYNAPILSKMLRISAFVLIFNAMGIAPKALLQRQLRFKELALATTGISLFSGGVALAMAYHGYAYWSLIAQSLLSVTLLTMICALYAHWAPSWLFSMESFRHLITFGLPMLFTSLVHAIYSNIYTLVVGRFYSAQELGLYSKAEGYSYYVPFNLCGFSMRALYPLLSRVQDDLALLKESALKILHTSLFIVLPINVFLLINSEDIIRIVLTDKWVEMSPLMQVMCISSMAFVVSNLHFNLFKAIGKTQILFICELIKKILGVIVLFVTFRYGLMVMVWGILICSYVNVVISSWFVWHFINITFMDQIKQVQLVLLNGLAALAACYLVGTLIEQLHIRFAMSFVVFFGIYVLMGILTKDKTIDFIKGYLQRGDD